MAITFEASLNANELCHALGVEIGSTDIDPQKIPVIETLLGSSLGLVTLEASSYTPRLVHYTLQEYLSNNTDLFHNPHSAIAKACLTYLNFQCIRDLSPNHSWSPQEAPFLKYASCYWETHARGEIMEESMNTLALKLLDGFDNHISSGILLSLRRDNWDSWVGRADPTRFTGLHCAAYLRIVELAVGLLKVRKWDHSTTEFEGNTAILWASRKGHGAIVKVVLQQDGVTPSAADRGGRTLLLWAVKNGCEDVVKMLLERDDVNPNTADEDDQTPLSWAVRMGYEGILSALLAREDTTPNTPDKGGQTPLLLAAIMGHQGIVRALLGRGCVSLNAKDKHGRTPLSWAARSGYWSIVELIM